MKSKEITRKRTFVLRLERGDEIIESLSNFCKENKILGGTIQGIGAISYAKLYSVQNSKEFLPGEKEFQAPMELISTLGNITTDENNNPLLHIHTCLGFPDKSSKVGHLLKGTISFNGEFFIQETDKIDKRKEGKMNLIQI